MKRLIESISKHLHEMMYITSYGTINLPRFTDYDLAMKLTCIVF